MSEPQTPPGGAGNEEPDPATAENPPDEIRAGDKKRKKEGAPDTAAEAGVGGLDGEPDPTTAENPPEQGGAGDKKRKKEGAPDTAAEAGVGGLD
ncbi:MAG: hypothetical protein ACRD1G_20725 [Acidimicrobiales bacterium]